MTSAHSFVEPLKIPAIDSLTIFAILIPVTTSADTRAAHVEERTTKELSPGEGEERFGKSVRTMSSFGKDSV